MKIKLKGNTAKDRKFCPATKDMPAMLYLNVAEKIKRRDDSVKTVWYHVKVPYKYAETINAQIPEGTSRYMELVGHVSDEPQIFNGKARTTIWADEITWLDNKWPTETVPAGDPANEPDLGAVEVSEASDDLDCPW